MDVSKTYFKVVGWGLVVLAAVVSCLNAIFFDYSKDFWQNLMVEMHGALLDVLLFTLILHVVLSRSLTAEANEKATSTLDKLRYRSTLKVTSKDELFDAISTLQSTKNTIRDIHFNHDLSDINLTGTILENCLFEKESNLARAEFAGCTFRNCELMVDLAILRQSLPAFKNCTFIECNLRNVKGDSPDFEAFETSQFFSCDMSENLHEYANNLRLIKD
ncbi:pentapeptide repeat-containing protein [Alteromonas antoniana]|uniref:pentapeptide repeat-containing protein n=1 Tax=Alteromonas antoniana TaxID=2803813 RepID=UPI001C453743|nr:pentapeptide repeat-containing protein [Alteromonas antoniana]